MHFAKQKRDPLLLTFFSMGCYFGKKAASDVEDHVSHCILRMCCKDLEILSYTTFWLTPAIDTVDRRGLGRQRNNTSPSLQLDLEVINACRKT